MIKDKVDVIFADPPYFYQVRSKLYRTVRLKYAIKENRTEYELLSVNFQLG